MEASAKTKTVNRKWQKYAYAVFLIAGIYFLIQKDYNNAVVFGGLRPSSIHLIPQLLLVKDRFIKEYGWWYMCSLL